jgi:hypothetical protein
MLPGYWKRPALTEPSRDSRETYDTKIDRVSKATYCQVERRLPVKENPVEMSAL